MKNWAALPPSVSQWLSADAAVPVAQSLILAINS